MAGKRLKTGELYLVDGRLLRYLHPQYSTGVYCDGLIFLKENPLSQLIGIIFRFFEETRERLARYEAEKHRFKEGDLFPPNTISYWIGRLYMLTNRFGFSVPSERLNKEQ